MTAMTIRTEQRAGHALLAWRQGARRRRIAGVAERVADASLAAGGLVLANATLTLEMGLPVGRAGWSLGIGLLAGGLAWMLRTRPRRDGEPELAAEMFAAIPQEVWRAA